jgi:hypothetical protein
LWLRRARVRVPSVTLLPYVTPYEEDYGRSSTLERDNRGARSRILISIPSIWESHFGPGLGQSDVSDPLGPVLCRILDVDFREGSSPGGW